MTSATPYDALAYPTAIFTQTHPDRLAVIARAAGLEPPDVASARVLEIGGGDGMNLIALAAAYPQMRCVNFDLAASAIARGIAWRDAAGIGNVEMLVLDILDAADAIEGPFDYIIAHGVYAWVPPEVRQATMALIGRLLAPRGVAFVSYNAQPGGHLRQALRDSLLHALDGIPDGEERVAAARAHLELLAEGDGGAENPFQTALRDAAAKTLTKRWAVLGHDELGPFFHPQALRDVVAAAADCGLAFLGDADRELMHHAFLPDEIAPSDDSTGQIVRYLQARDYREIRFFRQTLLVRADNEPRRRRLDLNAMRGLLATARCDAPEGEHFMIAGSTFEVRDGVLAGALRRMVEARPTRVPVAELVDSDERLHALFEMFDAGLIDLHTGQAPFAVALSNRPQASALVRMMIEQGMGTVCTLDHRMLGVTEDGPRRLLGLLDGTCDVSALLPRVHDIGIDTPDKLHHALAMCLREGLLTG